MKSILMKKIQEEFGVYKIQGKKLGKFNFYTLCGFYKALKQGKEVK